MNMHFWSPISEEIACLEKQYAIISTEPDSTSNLRCKKDFGCICGTIAEQINDLDLSKFPDRAQEIIEDFIKENMRVNPPTYYVGDKKSFPEGADVKMLYSRLLYLDSRIQNSLKDKALVTKKNVSLVFSLLNRKIVAIPSFREEWKKPWENEKVLHETYFEKLGACHFLENRIYAYKIGTAGANTDLVFNDNIDCHEEDYLSSNSMILTEWKKVVIGDRNEVEELVRKTIKKVSEAKTQLTDYKEGALYTMELKSHCYIVLVSQKKIKNLTSIQEKRENSPKMTYEIINIICDPDTPSKNAQKS